MKFHMTIRFIWNFIRNISSNEIPYEILYEKYFRMKFCMKLHRKCLISCEISLKIPYRNLQEIAYEQQLLYWNFHRNFIGIFVVIKTFLLKNLISYDIAYGFPQLIWIFIWMSLHARRKSLKRKCRHFDENFITGCTGSCHFDNFQCSQWWKFHQNDDMCVSVNMNPVQATTPYFGTMYIKLAAWILITYYFEG